MPVVRLLGGAAVRARDDGLATAPPGCAAELLWVYDYVKVTQRLLGVKPRPMHPGAGPDGAGDAPGDAAAGASINDDDDGASARGSVRGRADDEASVASASAPAAGDAAPAARDAAADVVLTPSDAERLSRMTSALGRARAMVGSDDYGGALSALRRPLMRSERLLAAARSAAADADAAAAADGPAADSASCSAAVSRAVGCRARLALSLSVVAQARSLQATLTAVCDGGGAGASDAVRTLRDAESLMVEYARVVALPEGWQGPCGRESSPAVARLTGSRRAALPLEGAVRVSVSGPPAEGMVVAAAPADAVCRVRETLCQQLVAAGDFEDAAAVVASLSEESLRAELGGGSGEAEEEAEEEAAGSGRRFGPASLSALQASLASAMARAMLDRASLSRAIVGDAVRGAFVQGSALSSAVARAREAFVAAASGAGGAGGASEAGVAAGTWLAASSTAQSCSELLDAETMLTGAARLSSGLCRLLVPRGGPAGGGGASTARAAAAGVAAVWATRSAELSSLAGRAPPAELGAGGAASLADALSVAVPASLAALRAGAALCRAGMCVESGALSAAGARHVARAAADLGAAMALDSVAPSARCLLAAALTDAAIGPAVLAALAGPGETAQAPGTGRLAALAAAHAAVAFGSAAARAAALAPTRPLPAAAAAAALAASPCSAEPFRGMVASAEPGRAPAVRELVRVASAAAAVADAAAAMARAGADQEPAPATQAEAGAGAGALGESVAANTPGDATAGPAAAKAAEPSSAQMAELDDILAAMTCAGAL